MITTPVGMAVVGFGYWGPNVVLNIVCVPDPLNGGCVRSSHDPSDQNFGGPHGTETPSTTSTGQDG